MMNYYEILETFLAYISPDQINKKVKFAINFKDLG